MTPEAYSLCRTFEPAGPAEFCMDRHYLLYAEKGTLRLDAIGQRWTLPPARAALIAAGQAVVITILSQVQSASVLFSPDLVPPPPQPLSVFDVTRLARELIAECRQWGGDTRSLTPYAKQMFQALAAVAGKLAESPSPLVLPLPSSPALARAIELTELLSSADPSFSEIARGTGQSSRSLARRFSDELGMTWREALRRIRLLRAIEALVTTDAPVTEIAFAVGYKSVSSFNAAFREMTGQTPSEYRDTLLP